MTKRVCPDCRAQRFYVKDPDDSYTISEFSLENDEVEYIDDEYDGENIEVNEDTEIFCDRCAWHDSFSALKKIA